MNLVIDLEAKRGGRGRSWGESTLSGMAAASEEAVVVSSKCRVDPLRQDREATPIVGQESSVIDKEAAAESRGSVSQTSPVSSPTSLF